MYDESSCVLCYLKFQINFFINWRGTLSTFNALNLFCREVKVFKTYLTIQHSIDLVTEPDFYPTLK